MEKHGHGKIHSIFECLCVAHACVHVLVLYATKFNFCVFFQNLSDETWKSLVPGSELQWINNKHSTSKESLDESSQRKVQ